MGDEERNSTDGLVTFEASSGGTANGRLLRVTPGVAAFEIYSPDLVLRSSEVLNDFTISMHGGTVYSGKAVVVSLINTGTLLMCEVRLDDAGLDVCWAESTSVPRLPLAQQFGDFFGRWQKVYRVLPQFKSVMGDMQSFLADLRVWLDRVELEMKASSGANGEGVEDEVVGALAEPIIHVIDTFVDRFESIAASLEPELHPVHRNYLRRQLHPLLLASPFAHRAFHKPLGYAGDYEIVNMMMRPPHEGTTLFARIINVWLLGQAPARAHRNRVDYLLRKLVEEGVRCKARGRPGWVYNLGCGPAAEIQRFLEKDALNEQLRFTLLDFNQETLAYARSTLEGKKRAQRCSTSIEFIQRSVQQVLKDAMRPVSPLKEGQYDFIYCAGLFDYLPDAICKRLMDVFYGMLAPGGLLVATNLTDAMNTSRPFRYSVEYILDWHLVYRNGPEMWALVPDGAQRENCSVITEDTAVNVFIEVRKPLNG